LLILGHEALELGIAIGFLLREAVGRFLDARRFGRLLGRDLLGCLTVELLLFALLALGFGLGSLACALAVTLRLYGSFACGDLILLLLQFGLLPGFFGALLLVALCLLGVLALLNGCLLGALALDRRGQFGGFPRVPLGLRAGLAIG